MDQGANKALFEERLSEFIAEHHNEYVVIAEGKVHGFFLDYASAFMSATRSYPMGSFIIQKCCDKSEDTFAFYSPIFS